MAESIFTKIIKGELPATRVYENERLLAIKDIYPVAPVHLLIFPKKEIRDLQSVAPEDLPLIAEMAAVAQELAKKFGVEEGYRLVTNNGAAAGQEIFHFHFHLIGGRPLGPLLDPMDG